MTDNKFDFWIANNLNVLFCGKHGTGKTARIVEAFNRNKLKWKYFSASTLDPWVDFVGVPKEVKDANGNSYLDLIRPKHFAEDDVEAIFMDEYNRAPAKIRNATMELLQFKSINGKKFKNLRFIWAAINPDNEILADDAPVYDVEVLDPAQKDRFEIQIHVPYKPDITFFKNKFGEDIGKSSVGWWHDLTEKEKNDVSPRRLDYAISVFKIGGDMRDVLPKNVNVSKLVTELQNGSFRENMEAIFKQRDFAKAKSFFADENSYNNTIKYILDSKPMTEFFFPFFSEEKQSNLITTDDRVMKYAFTHSEEYKALLGQTAKLNKKVGMAYEKYVRNKPVESTEIKNFTYGKKFKFDFPPKMQDTHTFGSYIEMVNDGMLSIGNGTPYRKSLFRNIIWAVYNDKGYAHTLPIIPLTEIEIELTLNALNSIIASTYTDANFPELPMFYGLISKEYITKFGKKQNIGVLSIKVQTFLLKNADLYI